MTTLVNLPKIFVNCQVENGAQVIQVFDSWAGHLSPKDYDTFAAPYQVINYCLGFSHFGVVLGNCWDTVVIHESERSLRCCLRFSGV